ncbi:MAG TPA: hypothetical protein VIO95_05910 [Mycobacterium sp.]
MPSDEPTASAPEANSANPPRRRHPFNDFATWARIVAGAVIVASAIAVVFFAGFFTEREYGDLFAGFEGSLASDEDMCIQTFCVPAGRAGQHCRQYYAPC